MQASSHNSQVVIDVGLNEAGVSTAHQTAVQYSAVEWTRAKVAVRNVVAPTPQSEPTSCLKSAMRDVSFFLMLLRGIWSQAEGQDFVVDVDFQLTFSVLVVKMEGCPQHLCCAELKLSGLEVLTYGCYVLVQHPFHCLPVPISMHDC